MKIIIWEGSVVRCLQSRRMSLPVLESNGIPLLSGKFLFNQWLGLLMGWRKRVQKIADRDPSKLHPIIQAARGLSAGEEAWDRVSWQTEGEGNISAESAARPIFVMLNWLNEKRLLTSEGKAALKSQNRASPDRLILIRRMVRPPADVFLDQFYQEWYETVAINYSIDPTLPIGDPEIDPLWERFNSS